MMLGYICTPETQRQTYVIDMVADISKLHTDCHVTWLPNITWHTYRVKHCTIKATLY